MLSKMENMAIRSIAMKKKAADNKATEATALSTAMMLMAERSPGKGAMSLPPESFKNIYQFLSRVVNNYHKHIHVMIYSVIPEEDGIDLEQAMEKFTSIVKASLRQSDVITRHGKNQVMILLLKALPSDIEIVTERIEMNWEAEAISDFCKTTYEVSEI